MKNISDNPFWQYSVQVWPKANPILLMLQENYQLDINMVLFCCWLTKNKLIFQSVEQLENHWPEIVHWQNKVICPLRAIRLVMSELAQCSSPTQDLYARCKQIELNAEYIQQKRLFNLTDKISTTSRDNKEAITQINVHHYLAVSGNREDCTRKIDALLMQCLKIIKGP